MKEGVYKEGGWELGKERRGRSRPNSFELKYILTFAVFEAQGKIFCLHKNRSILLGQHEYLMEE